MTAEAAADERTDPRRLPDFFIVGHAKSGTTALYEMLRAHPQIYMSDFKEPQFFARNPEVPTTRSGVKRFEQTGKRSETLDDYLSLFLAARADQRIGDASTFHLFSHAAPARIARAQPAARIIAILREPASFLHSLHLQMLQNNAESEKDLRKAIALEDARRRGQHIPAHAYWPEALIYSERVKYAEQLRRYHEVFPSEQVLVLIYDDFRRENEATVRRVLRFLEVDDSVPIQVLEANPSVGVRSLRLRSMVGAVQRGHGPLSRAVRGTVKATTPRGLRRDVVQVTRERVLHGSPQAPDEQLMLELRRRFKGEVQALSEYLGRDLVSAWGYDKLG